MWTVCITSISHVLKLNGYGGPQAKVNEKNQGFKGWETLVSIYISRYRSLMPFTLMDNSSAFATNSSHVNVQGVFAIVLVYTGN